MLKPINECIVIINVLLLFLFYSIFVINHYAFSIWKSFLQGMESLLILTSCTEGVS